jgi:cold shock protein
VTGSCAWWSNTKGYGFLRPLDGTEDVFVHHSNVNFGRTGRRNLKKGSLFEFETGLRDGRVVAVNVRPASEEILLAADRKKESPDETTCSFQK